MAGRKPKPTNLKLLTGNPGKRALNHSEPKYPAVAPEPPDWLSDDAREVWDALSQHLTTHELLTIVDGPAFALMVVHYSLAATAYKELKKAILTTDEDGLPRKHPAHQILRDNSAAFRQYATEFGVTPSSRSRIRLPEPGGEDEFEAFLDS